MIFFVNKTREERRCKNTTSNSMLERKKHRIRTIYGGPRSFAKKEENSLAGELSKVRNNVLFLQHIALKEILE